MIGIAVVVGIIIWLAVFVVLPVLLLNSALGFTILALCLKGRRTLFAALSLVGGGYILIDIFAGWLSLLFVNNVVGNPLWITCFVYLNAAAIGLSTWFLVQPIWANSVKIRDVDKRKSIALMGTSVLLVTLAVIAIPIVYYNIQTLFITKLNDLKESNGTSETRTKTSTTKPSSTSNVPNLPTTFQRNYEGTIGNQSFSISLVRDGTTLTGRASTSRKSDTLSGTIDATGQFEMKGYEDGKRFTGIYKGDFYSNGVIEGSWTKPDGSKETSFSVSQKY